MGVGGVGGVGGIPPTPMQLTDQQLIANMQQWFSKANSDVCYGQQYINQDEEGMKTALQELATRHPGSDLSQCEKDINDACNLLRNADTWNPDQCRKDLDQANGIMNHKILPSLNQFLKTGIYALPNIPIQPT